MYLHRQLIVNSTDVIYMRASIVQVGPNGSHWVQLKAKFHYASWFGAGSKLVRTR